MLIKMQRAFQSKQMTLIQQIADLKQANLGIPPSMQKILSLFSSHKSFSLPLLDIHYALE